MEQSGLSDLFRRIEIVSEKHERTYRRLFEEFAIAPEQFLMVGNSLRSDIEPVVRLGGWGVHVPYHVTWSHELDHGLDPEHAQVVTVESPASIPAAITALAAAAAHGS